MQKIVPQHSFETMKSNSKSFEKKTPQNGRSWVRSLAGELRPLRQDEFVEKNRPN
jgi:hypothetical protein